MAKNKQKRLLIETKKGGTQCSEYFEKKVQFVEVAFLFMSQMPNFEIYSKWPWANGRGQMPMGKWLWANFYHAK